MAKYNKKNSGKEPNVGGGVGFKRTDKKKEFASVILNSMLKGDTFYKSEREISDSIMNFINEVDPLFYAKAMVYVRNNAYLRSVSHLMGVTLVENVKGQKWTREALRKTMLRPDDATEMVALWNSRHEENVPNSLRRAVRDALENNWDAYQLRKYYGTGAVKVPDLIKLSHPKPKDKEQSEIFKKAIKGKRYLPSIQTAQTVNASKSGVERVIEYLTLLKEGKLGYMALLKNLKNILEVELKDTEEVENASILEQRVEILKEALLNEKGIKNSKVLPIRFYQAYKSVKALNIDPFDKKEILKTLEKAFIISAENVKILEEDERGALLVDESGSMQGDPFLTALVLTAASMVRNKNTIGMFWSNYAREVELYHDRPLEWIDSQRAAYGGTDLAYPLVLMTDSKVFVDKIVIFTDMQQNSYMLGVDFSKALEEYRNKVNKNVKVLFWNLAPYGGATPVRIGKNNIELTGFSDKMLEIVGELFKDPDFLIKEIEKINLGG